MRAWAQIPVSFDVINDFYSCKFKWEMRFFCKILVTCGKHAFAACVWSRAFHCLSPSMLCCHLRRRRRLSRHFISV